MKNATYVDQCDTIRTLTDGRSRSPQRGVQNMRKSSLVLAALFSFAVSAEAAPKVVDSKGAVIGTVIGVGTVMVTAPDGNEVAVSVGDRGFLNSLPPKSSYPLLYLDDPTCTTPPYLLATSLPQTAWVFIDDQTELFSPSVDILYPKEPYVSIGEALTYAIGYDKQSSSYVCQQVSLLSSIPIGRAAGFKVSYSAPFSVSRPPAQ
jgi:hypothetical protein